MFGDVWKRHNKHCKDCRQTFSVYWDMKKHTGHGCRQDTDTRIYECVYIYVYIVMYLYAHVWFYAQFPPGNSLGKWIHWVFTELRAASPDSWNLSSWRDCCDVAGLLLLCYPFPFYQSWCLLLRSPRTAWELQFPRSRISPDALLELLANPHSSVATSGK